MKLPVVMEPTREFHIVTGTSLTEDGIEEINGEKVDPDLKYSKPMPVQIARNDFRRMKKAFKNHGAPGVARYILSVNELAKKQHA